MFGDRDVTISKFHIALNVDNIVYFATLKIDTVKRVIM